tara:strand:+ start:573 stop:902 length:330 start_codon:yes stop_codon:yes gene_type:complete
MDQRLSKALEFSNYLVTFKNQKRILEQQYIASCKIYYNGAEFTVSPSLILLLELDHQYITDDRNIPIFISNIEEFKTQVRDTFNSATKTYYSEYQKLISNRTVQGLIDV